MTDAILDAAGTVDKYMGDAIVAFWNAPLDDPDHARHAVGAALAMRRTLVTLNEGWRTRAEAEGRSFKPVRFGIGLNSGECCVGNLGSLRQFDYSAIGDEVNVASRLEGACKIFEVDIIGSETTRAEAPDFAWLEIDSVLLKNKTRPVGLYALAGDRRPRRERGICASEPHARGDARGLPESGLQDRGHPWPGKLRPARPPPSAASIRTTCAASPNWTKTRWTRIGVL